MILKLFLFTCFTFWKYLVYEILDITDNHVGVFQVFLVADSGLDANGKP